MQDFRRPGSKELSTSFVFIIREIQQKQAWIRELMEENNDDVLDFVGRFSIQDKPEHVAQDILNTLNVNPVVYKSDNPIKKWIEAVERNGIFVSKTSFIHSRLKLDSEELQGFAIADPYVPFIFINSEDWSSAQLFTLAHELAHIWIAETGISNEIMPDLLPEGRYNLVKIFCNEVAANILIPKEILINADRSVFSSSKDTFRFAKQIGVSSFTILVRALKLNIISLSLPIRF